MRWIAIALVLMVSLSGMLPVDAQDTPDHVLTEADKAQTSQVQTGDLIEIQLPYGYTNFLNIIYNPAQLRFIPDTIPAGLLTPAPTFDPNAPLPAPPTLPPPDFVPPTLVANPTLPPESLVDVFHFRVLAAGNSVIEFRTGDFLCGMAQSCPIILDFNMSFSFEATGDNIPIEPVEVTPNRTLSAVDAGGAFGIQRGQIITIDAGDLNPLLDYISYNPYQLEYLPGDELNFRVLNTDYEIFLSMFGGGDAALDYYLFVQYPASNLDANLLPLDRVDARITAPNQVTMTIAFTGPSQCENPIQFREDVETGLVKIEVFRESGGICTKDLRQQELTYVVNGLEAEVYFMRVNNLGVALRVTA